MLIDIIAVIVVLASTFIAFLRGFIREVLTIAGAAGALAAAYYGGPILIPYLRGWIGIDEAEVAEDASKMPKLFDTVPYDILATVISYGAIFVVVLIILSIISHIIAEIAKTIGLGAIDRTFGVIFGIARGVLLLGLLYLPIFLTHTTEDEQKKVERWFDGAQSHVYMEVTAKWIAQFLPETTKDDIKKQVEEGTEKAIENGARDTLERMDLLNNKTEHDNARGAVPQDGTGYNENFREEMDELFQQEQVTPNGANDE